MILRSLRILVAGVLLAFAAGALAQAQDPKLWYVAGGVGVRYSDDMDFTGTVPGTLQVDPGYSANVAIGRYLDDIRVIRLELEGIAARSRVAKFNSVNAGGQLENASLMVNFLYDIKTDSPWVPFLGGGIGYSRVRMNDVNSNGVTITDSEANGFAYQFKGGVAYEFNPSMAVTVLYRYFATDNLSFEGPPQAPGTVKSDGIRSHNAEVGFRFNF